VRGESFDHSLRRSQSLRYLCQNTIRICEHIVIPKPQYQKTRFIESLRPACIFFTPFRMLPTIQLHNQLRLVTKEIRNIPADRNLPAELEPEKLPVADARPQFALGVRLLPPEFPG
jgi:hypothetical protein